jgi:hypothetical protein
VLVEREGEKGQDDRTMRVVERRMKEGRREEGDALFCTSSPAAW